MMLHNSVIPLLFAAIWVTNTGYSQDSISLDLESAISLSLMENTDIAIARHQINVSEYAVKEAFGNFLPKFIETIHDEEFFTPANYKRELPAHIDGFFYIDEADKLNFKLIEIGISSGLESEVKGALDETLVQEGDQAINSVKSKN